MNKTRLLLAAAFALASSNQQGRYSPKNRSKTKASKSKRVQAKIKKARARR